MLFIVAQAVPNMFYLTQVTNRMEEAVGDCTNLHITYPALVAGFMTVLRANRMIDSAVEALPDEAIPPERAIQQNDVAIDAGGAPVESIIRKRCKDPMFQ
ncbi:hypothetical protein [Antarcticimicrobium luteum]|uniref:Uncharacterized protein n=1 Tax=Antarcticimicrobium luteum TaxID=2547397 RepID=A0A4R5VEW3_9RHOB|nr:hypothetical protein [Antarcticimicrobium luteum]TDK50348.1 hypothetical protein E1832_06900 [Antarcticimicrobium luteum]